MAEYTVTDIPVEPYFDLELLMSTSQETRIGGEMMDTLSDAWDRWVPQAHARKIEAGGATYLLAWLGEGIEDEVDDKWEQTPSEAFLFNALAQVLCMGIVHSLLPQVEEAGCAPAPQGTDVLADALEAAGVPYANMDAPGLLRRYGVLTYFPFKGGCEICALRGQCPKSGGGEGVSSVTLPGFEGA